MGDLPNRVSSTGAGQVPRMFDITHIEQDAATDRHMTVRQSSNIHFVRARSIGNDAVDMSLGTLNAALMALAVSERLCECERIREFIDAVVKSSRPQQRATMFTDCGLSMPFTTTRMDSSVVVTEGTIKLGCDELVIPPGLLLNIRWLRQRRATHVTLLLGALMVALTIVDPGATVQKSNIEFKKSDPLSLACQIIMILYIHTYLASRYNRFMFFQCLGRFDFG